VNSLRQDHNEFAMSMTNTLSFAFHRSVTAIEKAKLVALKAMGMNGTDLSSAFENGPFSGRISRVFRIGSFTALLNPAQTVQDSHIP
jgi:hypothetical protein